MDRLNVIEAVRADIPALPTPEVHGRLELTKFHSPTAVSTGWESTPNTLGLRSVTFEIGDIGATLAGLRAHGGDLIRTLVQRENSHRPGTSAAPAEVIVGLAKQLR